jgi:UDP-glucose 4-epimerase
MNFKNVAVIGSNGFIGSHLTNKLLKIPGINIFLFGRNERNIFGDKLPYNRLNVSDKAEVSSLFSEIDIIYYLASETIPSSSWENPVIEIEKNLVPFINFLECIVQLKAKKIVFVSSGGTVYGSTQQKVTEEAPTSPFSPHGITKLTMEYFLNYFNKKYGLSFDTYRVSNVYGAGQNTGKGIGIINTFLEHIISENKIRIFGNGENVRNYLYVNDLADILALSLFTDPSSFETFNAASNDTLTINALVQVIKKAVKENFEVIYTETRASDNSTIFLDNSKLLLAHPGITFTPIEEGILRTWEYIKNNA